jgi:hypothetical protein
VQTVEREAGLGSVIEALDVERPQLGVHSGVLDVTRDAIAGSVAVDTLALGNPLRDRLVTRQALLRCDAASS